MLGELNNQQIEHLLKQQVTGRIACHANSITYIVPVNYVYDGTYIYSHSSPGRKIEIMRTNPQVCFEVDDIQNIFKWQSAIVWGTFEEVTDISEKQRIMQSLIHRIMPLSIHPTNHPSHGIAESDSDIGISVELIVYRIAVNKKTGRFENN
ncbi:pyridoxamine 5'-phosphate oxidase family protein [Mucilaginibacter calamicampi]|uniref:Pyridoxamine 5'-phosphate oxidase family protein n=1 Tax=Mucilaginibacter calamicampi TaxID=1302352 RepID=A0ABW2Z0K5_9SPHI